MKKSAIRELAVSALITTIYVIMTWALSFSSFGVFQIRVAEALVLLCFFNKKYFTPLVLGCVLANLFSPYGLIDVVMGSIATAIGLFGVMKSKNIYIASIFPVVSNALIIGFELTYLNGKMTLPIFLFNAACVGIGEFISVSVIGVMLFMILKKNHSFMELIEASPERYLSKKQK